MKQLEIGDRILSRIEAENRSAAIQRAKGYVEMIDEQGNEKIIWLVPGELQKSRIEHRNIIGDVVGTSEKESPYLKIGGLVLSKNSPFGNALAEMDECIGMITYKTPTGTTTSKVNAKAEYQINTLMVDAIQGTICTEDEDKFPFEASLRERLKDLRELFEAKTRETASEEELLALQKEIESLEQEIAIKAKNARRYRRTTSSIRQKFKLDPEQNRIKRQKLFSGPLVINGGPGTGKTTLLIHKIQYMLDPMVEQDDNFDVKLSNEEWSFIRNQKTGWIFFSPTDLLKKYLQDAMTAEGLEAYEDTVKTWHQQRNLLKTSFGFFGNDKVKPFVSYTDKDPLWRLTAHEINSLLTAFDSFLLDHFIEKINRLNKVKVSDLPWSNECTEIGRALQSVTSRPTIQSLILALNSLIEKYGELRITIDKEYSSTSGRIASGIQRKLNEEDKEWFKQLLRERKTSKTESVNEEEEQEQEDLVDAFEEEEVIDGQKLDIDINRLIKRIIRIDALSSLDSNTKVSKGDKEILERIITYIDKTDYPKIAAYSLFIKYFKPFLKGSDNTILSKLPRVYKLFRRVKLKDSEWLSNNVKEKLATIIESTPKNTRIHEDELDLLILLALRLARIFYSTSLATFKESKHAYLITFNVYMKGLVAIDEATDFTPVQINCMYHLSRPRLNTVLMAGDIMQQMNPAGINAWSEIESLLPNTEIAVLYKSFRQTGRLLNLAIKLYEARYRERPKFYASESENENDPAPLVYINENFDDKINWIAERILELHDVYENTIPNIAVFVKDNATIELVAQALNDNQSLLNKDLKVKGCVGEGEIGSAEFVRVFNINLIKGMEFETVFFFDVDDYDNSNQEILDKLIYVGVSRATYYLAITLKKEYPERLKPIASCFMEGTWSKNIISDY